LAQIALLFGHQRSGTNITVSSIEKNPDVTLYNENHPSVFRDFHLISFDRIGEVAATTPTKLALFKPISNTPEIFEIGERYKEAKAILAVRHYVPVHQSYIKAFGDRGKATSQNLLRRESLRPTIDLLENEIPGLRFDAGNSSDLFLLSWIHRTRLMLEFFESNRDRCVLSLYEDFVGAPRTSLKKICRLLDIDFKKSMAVGIRQRSFHHRPPNAHPALCSHAEELYIKAVELKHSKDNFIEKLSTLMAGLYSAPFEKLRRISRKKLRKRGRIGAKPK
jgi:hypothetical protein